MKTTKYSLPAVAAAALVVISPIAFSQQRPVPARVAATAHRLPLGQVRPMSVALAKTIVAAAKKAACSPPAGACSGAFAVVDDAGVLVYLETIDGVLAGGPNLAIRKAKTSALWRRPTILFQEAVNKKTNTAYADGTFQDMTTSPGGLPLFKNGRVVGGFGSAAVGSRAAIKQINRAVTAEATRLFGPQ
ncbi:MAG: GlcG/HbpS family heme-binding protein [Steroidobacteraceae bacterium]